MRSRSQTACHLRLDRAAGRSGARRCCGHGGAEVSAQSPGPHFRPSCELGVRVGADPTVKGAIAEAAIAAEAVKLGIDGLRPFVEGGRYDLVFDVGDRLLRVQCKWAEREGGVVDVHARTSRHTPRGYVRTTYGADEIDARRRVLPAASTRCYLAADQLFAGARPSICAWWLRQQSASSYTGRRLASGL